LVRVDGPVTFFKTWPSLVGVCCVGATPIAALKWGVADDATVTSALHLLPVLHGLPTR